jgi:hypothetical protein
MRCSFVIGTWMKAGIAEKGRKMVREWLMMLLVSCPDSLVGA